MNSHRSQDLSRALSGINKIRKIKDLVFLAIPAYR